MTQTTNEPLTGVDLAVFVAEEVMGWRRNEYARDENNAYPSFAASVSNIIVCMSRFDACRDWQPWRDPRAWWEIVEKMALSGYAFCLHNQDDNDIWDAAFVDEHGGIHATAQTPGEAVMLAALQAVRAQG